MKLTLLGTGTPIPDPARRGPSQVIEVGNELVLIDAGSGVLHRLVEAGYAAPASGRLIRPIRQIAITHLHSDHITGLADLLWTGWIMRWWDQPPPIAGPPGTAEFIRRLMDALAYDIDVRRRGERLRTEWLIPRVDEIDEGWTIDGYHTHSEEIGAIVSQAETRHLILSHILFRGGSPSDLITDIEPSYSGRLTVGADLQTFET